MTAFISPMEQQLPDIDNQTQYQVFENDQDDSADLDSIMRMIKFYLYNKLQASTQQRDDETPRIGDMKTYLNSLCDMYFNLEVDDADLRRQHFKKELETFKLHLLRDETSLLS